MRGPGAQYRLGALVSYSSIQSSGLDQTEMNTERPSGIPLAEVAQRIFESKSKLP